MFAGFKRISSLIRRLVMKHPHVLAYLLMWTRDASFILDLRTNSKSSTVQLLTQLQAVDTLWETSRLDPAVSKWPVVIQTKLPSNVQFSYPLCYTHPALPSRNSVLISVNFLASVSQPKRHNVNFRLNQKCQFSYKQALFVLLFI
jgi:hypothetical protein